MKESQLDMDLYADYFLKMQQSKFDINYYNALYSRCVFRSRVIKCIIVFVMLVATGIWMEWSEDKKISSVCAIIIIVVESLSAIIEFLPYDNRKSELRELSNELDRLFVKMESDWRKIRGLEYTNQEISDLIDCYQEKQIDIKNHYFKDDALPQIEKIREKAENKTEGYFKMNYESENKNER